MVTIWASTMMLKGLGTLYKVLSSQSVAKPSPAPKIRRDMMLKGLGVKF